jgi:hypothetical protein
MSGVPGASKKARKVSNSFAIVPVPVSAVRRSINVPPSQASSSVARNVNTIPPPIRRNPPPVNYKTRGEMPTHNLYDAERLHLLEDLDKDVLAPSTRESREANFRTWTTFHIRWFGSHVPVLPLSTESMRAVASQMKAAGYRTYPNYVVAAKGKHCEAHVWSDALVRCRAECIQSTQRGIGPARQCLEIPLVALARLSLSSEPLVPSGPICPGAWATLASFHMLRGAESALALATSLVVDDKALTESWYLPVSKTDPQAAGCLRSWGCVCHIAAEFQLCPYCSARVLKAELVKRFGDDAGALPEGLPLFPTAEGSWCSKAGFVATIAEFTALLGLEAVDLLGRNTIGEHAWRITGARHLAALDIPVSTIQLLARWGSDTVERYVAEAPLMALTRIYKEKSLGRGSSTASSSQDALGDCKVVALVDLVGAMSLAVPPPASGVSSSAELLTPFVSSITGKVHLVSLPPRLAKTVLGKTPCGWRYVEAEHTLLASIPTAAKCCERCGSPTVWGSVHAVMSQLLAGCTDCD